MSKRFKGKICVYCSHNPSTGGDHVFAREFFVNIRRGDLPQVPACDSCNRKKADLEHYLTAVLPFGGRHEDARASLSEMVPRRLARNRPLHLQLAAGISSISGRFGASDWSQTTVPFEGEKFQSLLAFVVKGLAWHHWATLLAASTEVSVQTLTRTGEEFFNAFLAMNGRQRIVASIGQGTFSYEGLQAVDDPQITVWRFLIFGGATFADADILGETASSVGVLTGPPRVTERVNALTG